MDKYIGIPYKKDGRDITACDCWGLLMIIYRDKLGIILPDYKGYLMGAKDEYLVELAQTMKEERKRWVKIDKPKAYDVALIRAGEFHVGIIVGKGLMIHIMNQRESVIESYVSNEWKHRIREFYRYE